MNMENVKKTPKELPLLIISGADDPVGDFGTGVKQAYSNYHDAGILDLTYHLYENEYHLL